MQINCVLDFNKVCCIIAPDLTLIYAIFITKGYKNRTNTVLLSNVSVTQNKHLLGWARVTERNEMPHVGEVETKKSLID